MGKWGRITVVAALWAFALVGESNPPPGGHDGAAAKETPAERIARIRAQTAAYEAKRQRELVDDLNGRPNGSYLFLKRDRNGDGAWTSLSATATGEETSSCRVGAGGYASTSHFSIRPSGDGKTFEITAKHRPEGLSAFPTFGRANPKPTEKLRWTIRPNFNGTFEVCDAKGDPLHGCREWTIATVENVDQTAFIRGAGDRHAIDASDVQQGNLGTCTLWAAVHAVLAKRGPEEIEKLFSNGEVTFPGRKPVETGDQFLFYLLPGQQTRPLGADFGDRDLRGLQESWPLLLEKAFTVWRRHLTVTDGGADPGAVLSLVTGEKVKYVVLKAPLIGKDRVFNCLADANDAGHPMVCGSKHSIPEDNALGLSPSHAYALKHVERGAAAGVILIDPHGKEVELTWQQFRDHFEIAAYTNGEKNAVERTVDATVRRVGDAVDRVFR